MNAAMLNVDGVDNMKVQTDFLYCHAGPEQCPRSSGQVNYADAALKLLHPSQSLTIDKVDVSGAWNIFKMTMSMAEAKPECRSVRSAALVKDVWCTIQTARVDILIELMMPLRNVYGAIPPTSDQSIIVIPGEVVMPGLTAYGASPSIFDQIKMAIPGAVLNVKLEEKLLGNGDHLAHILQLAEIRIQNISSIIDDIKRSFPKAAFDDWRKWVLANTGMLLQQAIQQRGEKQCQW
ncbi:unnamed protein product [Dibothriocephalus latus]|uniref:Uncharacterized protein n=1 Tax=Dibothriocephalus latus TaxID=60516 RepID=A0A3P7M620_DIBLA|nr:unnamed protein product [Dibothriocephalus latus]